MRLDTKDREILAVAQLQSDITVRDLARVTGYREHSIRYALQRLRDEEVIQPYPFINTYPLGFEQYGIFFSLASERKERKKVIAALEQREEIAWVYELGGDFQYGIAICAKNSGEVKTFLDNLSTQFGDIFFEKSIAVRTTCLLFPRKYLSDKRRKSSQHYYGSTGSSIKIDETDHAILAGLSSTDYSSYRDLAQLLKMPHTTLQYRIKNLREAQIISGFAYGIDCTKFGMQPYRLLIYLKKVSVDVKQSLNTFCRTHRNVFAIIECLGSWDFEIKVEVDSARDLMNLVDELYERFNNHLQTIKVLSILGTKKLEFYPFKQYPFASSGNTSTSKSSPTKIRTTVRHFD